MKIRIIQHERWLDGGAYIIWANKNKHELLWTKVFNYEEVPSEVDADMLLVLGGPQSPDTSKEVYPYYDNRKEKELIRKYFSQGKIVIGSCLGAQLLGSALGSKHLHSPYLEVGYVKARFTNEGRKDPFFKDFPNELDIGSWHEDMPGLTNDAVLIMSSDGCPHQIVRYAKYAYGFQTHMEFTHESILNGIKENKKELETLKGPYIKSVDEIINFDTREMNICLETFLDNISKDYLENNK